MKTTYFAFILLFIASISLTGCNEDDLFLDNSVKGGDVSFEVEINGYDGDTRGIMEDSKTQFEIGEIIHIQAVFNCEIEGVKRKEVRYGVMKYDGHGIWKPLDAAHTLRWPDDCTTGTFKAYYIAGSTGILSGNPMPEKLLSDYRYDEVPLFAEVIDARYGDAIRLRMKHMFAFLTLSELQTGVSNELWFSLPAVSDDPNGPTINNPNDKYVLNNAFHILFNPETLEITPEFTQITNPDYVDDNGNELVYIKSEQDLMVVGDELVPCVSFLLEPGIYHQFDVLFPRNRNIYATYLSYTRDLESVQPEGLKANGRYVFSVLKSLGVNIEEKPDDGWDDSTPVVIIDVEAFLRAVNSGSDYFETDPETGKQVQILEQTISGSKLLVNADFRNFYYDVFENGNWRPTQTRTFDGNYHYIWNMGCPLFYQNDGIITNLGIRNASTSKLNHPLTSCENLERWGRKEDTSFNGFIASKNNGTVLNVRVIKADMTVEIKTSDPDEPTQETHNVSLLFGENKGFVYDVYLADELSLTIRNASGENIIPRVMIGSVAGQNAGLVSGITYLDDNNFNSPDIKIYNNCKGVNGAYKIGGIAGINTGTLENIFINSLEVNATNSSGVESFLGGMVGENSSSASGPKIAGCIVRGEVVAGTISSVVNLTSVSYTGGIAGAFNTQGFLNDCSVSVGVKGSTNSDRYVDYAEGGAFGIILKTAGTVEGRIETIACYGSKLEGNNVNDYRGNFAGIVPSGFGWDHYSDNNISLRNLVPNNVALIR